MKIRLLLITIIAITLFLVNVLPATRLGAKDPCGAHPVTTSCAPTVLALHDTQDVGNGHL